MLSSPAHLSAVVLAAGAGTRMRNNTPKPLTPLNGKPLIAYVIAALATLETDRIVVVVGHGADQVSEAARLAAPDPTKLEFAHQHEQRGTGDAVWVGLQEIPMADQARVSQNQAGDQSSLVLVTPADAPLVRTETLQALLEAQLLAQPPVQPGAATLLTARVADPTGYGRILRSRDGTEVLAIVEHRDATEEQLQIDEINSSIYCFAEDPLRAALAEVMKAPMQNAQNEIQLTDVVAVLRSHDYRVSAMSAPDANEVMGVNDSIQLAACEVELQRRSTGS